MFDETRAYMETHSGSVKIHKENGQIQEERATQSPSILAKLQDKSQGSYSVYNYDQLNMNRLAA